MLFAEDDLMLNHVHVVYKKRNLSDADFKKMLDELREAPDEVITVVRSKLHVVAEVAALKRPLLYLLVKLKKALKKKFCR